MNDIRSHDSDPVALASPAIHRVTERVSATAQQKRRQHEVAVLAEYLTACLQINPAGVGLIVALGTDHTCRSNLEAVQRWLHIRRQRGKGTDPAREAAALKLWLIDSLSA